MLYIAVPIWEQWAANQSRHMLPMVLVMPTARMSCSQQGLKILNSFNRVITIISLWDPVSFCLLLFFHVLCTWCQSHIYVWWEVTDDASHCIRHTIDVRISKAVFGLVPCVCLSVLARNTISALCVLMTVSSLVCDFHVYAATAQQYVYLVFGPVIVLTLLIEWCDLGGGERSSVWSST